MKNFAASILALIALTASAALGQQHPQLVSYNQAGTGSGNGPSGEPRRQHISADGRYVVFLSHATDLVQPNGSGSPSEIFVRDLQTGTTTMASISLSGTQSNGFANVGKISDNGRYVAFTSSANNLVTNDNNASNDVFLRDLQMGTTRLVSVNATGTASGALGPSQIINMTPDGRFIVFSSTARDLTTTPDGNQSADDIYVRDMVNNVTSVVSMNFAGTASGNGLSFGASISADGRYVVFTSDASDLVAGDSSIRDVFIRDLQTQTTTRVSTNASGSGGGNAASSGGAIDAGGHFVVFSTRATDLSALPDNNALAEIFIYDVQAGTRRLITRNVAGTATGNGLQSGFTEHFVSFVISRDGRFVSFMSQSSNLVNNDMNGSNEDVFRYDIAAQTNLLVSVNPSGNSTGIGGSSNPSISADGHFVAFESLANNLVSTPDETNGFTTDIFVRDMVAGHTYLVSINSSGSRTGNGFSAEPILGADGTRLVFFSLASDLITNDLNGFNEDVFYFDVPSSPSSLATRIQFSTGSYQANENEASANVVVTRSGFISGENTVTYITSDSATGSCSNISGKASSKCDYGSKKGTVHFLPGETSKTIQISLVDDAYADGNETFSVSLLNATNATLGSPTNATITILDNDSSSGPNPIDQASFFVRQHYIDFLSREPDAAGLAFWTNQITECQQPGATCNAAIRRINVSAAFFLSIEFQETGYLVERVYKTAYGDATGTSNFGPTHQLSVPIVRFSEFLPDTQEIGRGLVVNTPGWEQVLENNKVAFIAAFVQRSRFSTSYSALLTPAQFVDQLFANAGVTPITADRNAAINEFGGAATSADNPARARALRRVAENDTLNQNEKNRAFVLTQYFGYLRRNPNDPQDTDYSGYDFWLTKLNQFDGNFVNADMVQAFIDSGEYRARFGP